MTYRIPHGIVEHLRTWGLTVVEYDGWQGRGHGSFPAPPLVIVCHHTGTPDSAPGDYPTKNVVINGRSDLEGPLCNFGLGRNGTVYMVADGYAWHAGQGTWDGINVGNEHSVGIEAESAGGGHWTPEQRHTYPLLCAALADYLSIPAKRVCAHRESATPHGRKDDPVGIDMDVMRVQVARLLRQGHPTVSAHTTSPPTPLLEENDMHLIHSPGHSPTLVAANGKGGLTLTKLSAGQAKTLGKTLHAVELTDGEYADYMALKNATAS